MSRRTLALVVANLAAAAVLALVLATLVMGLVDRVTRHG